MIEIHLTDSERQLQEATSKFVRETLNPLETEILAGRSLDKHSIAIIRQAASDLGILAPNIPQEYGGAEKSFFEICAISEELGKALPYARQFCQFPPRILSMLNDTLIEHYLKPCAKGEKTCAVVWDGADHGSNARDFAASAELNGSAWVLNGEKLSVENGEHSDFFIVFASVCDLSGPKPIAFIVNRESPGLQFSDEGSASRTDGITLSGIELSDCAIPSENVLGEIGQGFEIANEWLEESRLVHSAISLGTAQRCFRAARRQAIRKKAGGRPIALRQIIQWKLADMIVEIHGLKLMLYETARAMDQGAPDAQKLLILRCQASETATRVAEMTLDIFGSDGMAEDSAITKLIESARASKFYPENSEFLKVDIAKSVFDSV